MSDDVFIGATMLATLLRVRNVQASVRWYREKLGLEPLHVGVDGDHPVAAFSIAGGVVSLWQLPPGETRSRADNERNTYVVAVMSEDIEPLRQRLDANGVDVSGLLRSENNEFFWFHDLDDNRFEISRPLTPEFRTMAAEATRPKP
jgi:catechol 2,3-dioxygenase-like lactoylglutathione lyase family enzyme